MITNLRQFFRRPMYQCQCGLRTRDLYRFKMHRTLVPEHKTTHIDFTEEEDWPRWSYLCFALAAIAALIWRFL